MRQNFRLTEEQLQRILNASKPVPYIVAGGVEPASPRENAYRVWQALGDEMGFVWDSARPSSDGDQHNFTAVARNVGAP